MAAIAVLTNLPDSDSAFNLARAVVQLRLAACANVLAPATSFYRWEGRDEEATEYPVLIKSTRACYSANRAAHDAGHEKMKLGILPFSCGARGRSYATQAPSQRQRRSRAG